MPLLMVKKGRFLHDVRSYAHACMRPLNNMIIVFWRIVSPQGFTVARVPGRFHNRFLELRLIIFEDVASFRCKSA